MVLYTPNTVFKDLCSFWGAMGMFNPASVLFKRVLEEPRQLVDAPASSSKKNALLKARETTALRLVAAAPYVEGGRRHHHRAVLGGVGENEADVGGGLDDRLSAKTEWPKAETLPTPATDAHPRLRADARLPRAVGHASADEIRSKLCLLHVHACYMFTPGSLQR